LNGSIFFYCHLCDCVLESYSSSIERTSEATPNISVPQALEQNVKISKNSSSSVSNSKTNISTPQPGNNIRYFPNENPGGSGGSSNTESIEWQKKAYCPNVDVELDEEDDWSFKDIVEIPDEVLSQQRSLWNCLVIT
jgi:hypothetical protein